MDKELFDQHFITLAETYSQSLAKLAFTYMKNMTEAEDAVQDVFLAYYQKKPSFKSAEHERAWLIRSVINRCKNQLKSVWHRQRTELSDTIPAKESFSDSGLIEAVLMLKEKYRTPLHLYYFEECSIRETAEILGISESAAAKRISRAREKLKAIMNEKGGRL